jgi:O-antigen/teichoic acid export membrane protein
MKVTDAVARRETLPLVAAIIICTFAQFGTMFIPSILDARMQLSKPRIFELIGSVLGFLLLLLGIYYRVGLPCLATLTVAPGILIRLLMLPELFRTERSLILPHWPVAKRILREMWHPALLGMGIQCGNILISAAPNFMVVRLLSLADLTLFSISYQIATLPLTVLAAIVPVFGPAFTVAWRTGERKPMGRLLGQLCGATVALSLLFAVALALLGPWAIRLWTHGLMHPDGKLLFLLGIFVAVQGVLHWLSTFMWSVRELWIQIVTQAAAAAFLILFGWILGRPFGANGIAFAMIASLAAGALGPMAWRARNLTVKNAKTPANATI